MKHIVNNAGDAKHHAILEATFGKGYDLPKIQQAMVAIEGADIKIASRLPLTDKIATTRTNPDPITGLPVGEHITFGTKYFDPSRDADANALTMLHETIHHELGGTDHIVKATTLGTRKHEVFQDHIHGTAHGNPRDKTDALASQNMFVNGGCT